MLQPLAERMRPKSLDQIIGQEHLLGIGKSLRQIIEKGNHTELTALRGSYYELVKNQLELGS